MTREETQRRERAEYEARNDINVPDWFKRLTDELEAEVAALYRQPWPKT